MASKFLNTILNTLPAVQAKQISDLLQELQVAGEVRDSTEYTNKLRELSSRINNEVPIPSLSIIKSTVWSLCSSEAHNIMMSAAKNDLEAAFLQIDEAGSKLADHNVLFMQNLLKDLENNINRQENLIKELEWLADHNNSFTIANTNSFSSASCQLTRAEAGSKPLFFDNRTNNIVSANEVPSAIIVEQSKKLILNTEKNSKIIPVAVKVLHNNTANLTTKHVDSNSDINNILDGTINTYWTNTIYLESPVEEVQTVLQFDFGSTKSIFYMILETGLNESFYVDQISAITIDGARTNLLSSSVKVNGKTRIDFNKVNAYKVIITLSTSTYEKLNYYSRQTSIPLEEISNLIQEALSSNKLSNICAVPNIGTKYNAVYAYDFIIDNIWFGNDVYYNSSIFVSKPMPINNVGEITIDTQESNGTGIVKNSIEYDMVKIDYFPQYKETIVPLVKYNQTTVDSERLICTRRSISAPINNIGKLRFLPYITDNSSLTIYKNGEEFPIGRNWSFAVSAQDIDINQSLNWQTTLGSIPINDYNLFPLAFWIKITNPEVRAIYTVNYTIRTSDTTTIWLDKEKTLYLSPDGIVTCTKDKDTTIESDIYLQVTLRKNTIDQDSFPELLGYTLLANQYE